MDLVKNIVLHTSYFFGIAKPMSTAKGVPPERGQDAISPETRFEVQLINLPGNSLEGAPPEGISGVNQRKARVNNVFKNVVERERARQKRIMNMGFDVGKPRLAARLAEIEVSTEAALRVLRSASEDR